MTEIKFDKKKLNKILNNNGVIAFVTDTVWGIGCRVDNEQAVSRIYDIKGRDRNKPLILMSNKIEYLKPYVRNLSNTAQSLIDKYLPGALTIVAEKSELTPEYITSGKNTVGIRIPNNKFFELLCETIDTHVLATTSANISNEQSSKSYAEAQNSIGTLVDIIYDDYGYTCQGLESTVVLAVDDNINILRQGSIKLR